MALIDLFCGGGGFSLGAHSAGFEVAAAYDNDPILTSSYKRNFPESKFFLADITELTGEQIKKDAGCAIDGVFGGPPCQGFSSIGRRDQGDPRRELITHFFRIVNELNPSFFVMENVGGLAFRDSVGVLNTAIEYLGGRYDIFGPVLLDASEFGAATKRKRLFVIGTHKSRSNPICAESLTPFKSPASTVRHAISDLSSPKDLGLDDFGFDNWKITKLGAPLAYARKLRSADGLFTGHRLVVHREDVAKRFSSVKPGMIDVVGRHPRLAWEAQCPTLRAGTGSDKGSYQAVRPLHPEEPRVITVREAARLQGFPDKHRFHPTIWHSFRMIGNSVSPIIAEAVFQALKENLAQASATLIAAE